jgi:hypothetical protein
MQRPLKEHVDYDRMAIGRGHLVGMGGFDAAAGAVMPMVVRSGPVEGATTYSATDLLAGTSGGAQ